MKFEIYETPEGKKNRLTITPSRITVKLSPEYKDIHETVREIFERIKNTFHDGSVTNSFRGVLMKHELEHGFVVLYSNNRKQSLIVVFDEFAKLDKSEAEKIYI